MQAVALNQVEQAEGEPRLELLLAGEDAGARSLLASLARERVHGLVVLEAADGAEAIRLGLHRRPQIALLDVAMPRLGGIDAAITLRDLQPQMRLALHSDEPLAHRARARDHGLLIFDTLRLDAIGWLELQAEICAGRLSPRSALLQRLGLECSWCGYGIARSAPPERCPMCQSEGAWIHTPWRPFSGGVELLR